MISNADLGQELRDSLVFEVTSKASIFQHIDRQSEISQNLSQEEEKQSRPSLLKGQRLPSLA
jgi:hypothetical protein